MSDAISKASADVLANLRGLLFDLEAVYKDLHAHPELSMQEKRTATVAADRLRNVGYQVTTGIGSTGVVGLLTYMGSTSISGCLILPAISGLSTASPVAAKCTRRTSHN